MRSEVVHIKIHRIFLSGHFLKEGRGKDFIFIPTNNVFKLASSAKQEQAIAPF